jgi:hypothetical protein
MLNNVFNQNMSTSDFSWQNWNWNIQNEPRMFWSSSYHGQLTTTVHVFGECVQRRKHRIIGSQGKKLSVRWSHESESKRRASNMVEQKLEEICWKGLLYWYRVSLLPAQNLESAIKKATEQQ